MRRTPFLLAATIDFSDDCIDMVQTVASLEQIVESLQWIGVRRLYWQYDQAGQWERMMIRSDNLRKTTENLGGYPMALTGQMARQRGMEFYAIIKPYEMGNSFATPAASARSGLPCIGGMHNSMDSWIAERPDLRVQARLADLPGGGEHIPVQRIQLRQKDMTPIRIGPADLQIWVSEDNTRYRPLDVSFTLHTDVETCPRDVYDVLGRLITRKGDPVRVINLTDLRLTFPFIAVTTSFTDSAGAFRNTAIEMIRAFGPANQPLPIVVASHKSVWRRPRDFRTGDLQFDGGIGDFNVCLDVSNASTECPHCRERGYSDCMQMPLFPEEPTCRDGVIAFARGRNAYLPCAPCEAYPEVQEYWLSWVGECLRAGVDGVDWRISNHSSWVNQSELYGFNAPIATEYARRYGVNPAEQPYDPDLLADLRGEFYDRFLMRVKRRLAAAGKKLQVHLEADSFRPDAPQARRRTRPGHMHFHWRHWLRSGLAQEATLMSFRSMDAALADPITQDMLREASAAGAPVCWRQYMFTNREGPAQADALEGAYRAAGLSGYNYYDAACLYDRFRMGSDGRLSFYPGMLEALRERAQALGLA
jgi:hypothetical protein